MAQALRDAKADVLVLTLPLSAATRDMLGPPELAAMKPSAWLINVARGPIVDEAALLDASLMDYLAYGPGAGKFSKVLDGFKPEDNIPMKTTLQALQNAGLTLEALNTRWQKWVLTP